MTQMTVKIQKSITTTEPVPQALIYNKDKSFTRQEPWDPQLDIFFRGGRLKCYFLADVKGDEVELLEMLSDQDW